MTVYARAVILGAHDLQPERRIRHACAADERSLSSLNLFARCPVFSSLMRVLLLVGAGGAGGVEDLRHRDPPAPKNTGCAYGCEGEYITRSPPTPSHRPARGHSERLQEYWGGCVGVATRSNTRLCAHHGRFLHGNVGDAYSILYTVIWSRVESRLTSHEDLQSVH